MPKIIDDKFVNIVNDIEKVQKKPTMYISYTGPEGVLHLAREITNNVIDEHGNPKTISDGTGNIFYDVEENMITVEDHGRGIPFDELENACTILQSGSKMDRVDGDSAGENGVGMTVCNALSEIFEIISTRNGQARMLRFRDGKKIDDRIVTIKNQSKHGLTVSFKPSQFLLGEGSTLPIDGYEDWLQKLSFFMDPSLKLKFTVSKVPGKSDSVTKTYHNTTGIAGFLPYMSPDADFLVKPITLVNQSKLVEKSIPVFTPNADGTMQRHLEDMDRDLRIEFSFNYTTADDQPRVYAFCNDIENIQGGVHQDAVLNGLTSVLLKMVKDNQKKGDKVEVTGKDILTGLRLVLNLRTNYSTKFESQTKHKLGNQELSAPIRSLVVSTLTEFFKLQENKKYVTKISELLRENAKIRTDNTEKRSKIKREVPTVLNSKLIVGYNPANLVGKNINGEELELYIVEGQSAGGLVRRARYNNDIQGILATKGNPSNVYGISSKELAAQNRKSTKKIAEEDANEKKAFIVVLLDQILQCGYGDHYDESKLVYKKIIIGSDADIDGEHIAGIYLADIYKHAPKLIEHGFVYRVVAPLYRIELAMKKKKDASFVDPDAYLYAKSDLFTRLEETATKNIMIGFVGEDTCVSPSNVRRFLFTNREYFRVLSQLSATYRVSPDVIEYVVMHYDTFMNPGVVEQLDPELHYNAEKSSISGCYQSKFCNLVFEKAVNEQIKILINYFVNGNNKIGHYEFYKKVGTEMKHYGVLTIGQIMAMVQEYRPKVTGRYKGFGEMTPYEMQKLVLNPDYRVLLRFTINDVDATAQTLDHLFLKKFSNVRKDLVKNANVSPDDIDN